MKRITSAIVLCLGFLTAQHVFSQEGPPPADQDNVKRRMVKHEIKEQQTPLQMVLQEGPPPSDKTTVQPSTVRKERNEQRQQLQQNRESGRRRDFGHLAESPFLFNGKHIYGLLRYDAVQRELELLDYQSADVDQLKNELRLRRRETLTQFSKSDQQNQIKSGQAKELSENLAKIKNESKAEVEKVLLPAQIKRLTQIALELQIQSDGIVSVLKEIKMIESLGLEQDQLAQIRSQAAKCSRRFDAKVLELKKEIREEILATLNEQQRTKLKMMLGDKFEWNNKQNGDESD